MLDRNRSTFEVHAPRLPTYQDPYSSIFRRWSITAKCFKGDTDRQIDVKEQGLGKLLSKTLGYQTKLYGTKIKKARLPVVFLVSRSMRILPPTAVICCLRLRTPDVVFSIKRPHSRILDSTW